MAPSISTVHQLSLNFWFNIFNGKDYGPAFDEAKIAIEAINPLQVPQIDSDGNGVANEGADSALATGHRPGARFDIQVPGVFIGQVTTDQAINSNSATLGLGDISSPFPVEGAGALIVPPNFQRPSLVNDDEQPISGPIIDFTSIAQATLVRNLQWVQPGRTLPDPVLHPVGWPVPRLAAHRLRRPDQYSGRLGGR